MLAREPLDGFHRRRQFWARLITTDETWLLFFTPETKENSKQWLGKGSTPPVKAKSLPMQRKIMLTAFWDEEGIVHLDFLPDNETINADYYCRVLEDVHHHLRHRRRGKKSRGILLHQDNVRPHTVRRTKEKIDQLHWELLPHPPYSPDLAPSDYALFPHMKKFLRGRRFTSREELENEARSVLESIPSSMVSAIHQETSGQVTKVCPFWSGLRRENCASIWRFVKDFVENRELSFRHWFFVYHVNETNVTFEITVLFTYNFQEILLIFMSYDGEKMRLLG